MNQTPPDSQDSPDNSSAIMSTSRTPSDPDNEMGLPRRLLSEAGAMAEAALSRGKDVPPKVVTTIEAATQAAGGGQPIPPELVAELVSAHHTLATLIAPATPRTMRLLLDEGKNTNRFLRVLGPISVVRHLMLAGITSLVLFVAFCASPATDSPPRKKPDGATVGAAAQPVAVAPAGGTAGAGNKSGAPLAFAAPSARSPHRTIMTMDGLELIMNVGMWLAAAGIGASFVCLYKANRYVTDGTFDPMYEGSYWIRFFLGLISGLLLAVTVNEAQFEGNTLLEPDVIRVLLAIVGGFSAELFHTFLSRFVEACKSLFQGSVDEMVKTQVTREKVRLAALQMQEQMQQAAALMRLQQSIGGTTTPEEIKQQLGEWMNQVLPPKPGGS